MSAYEMYQQNILDRYRNPRNKGTIEKPTIRYRENNPLCGDEIEIQILVDKGAVKDVKFEGKGCAISMSSVDMLVDRVKKRKLSELMKLDRQEVLEMLGIPITPPRLKCALLGLGVLKVGIAKHEGKETSLDAAIAQTKQS
jgi:nitrogen fixation NifU-like protein